MSRKQAKRWNLYKAFFYHSENLLTTQASSCQDLIQVFLVALLDVYSVDRIYYIFEEESYSLTKNQLNRKKVPKSWKSNKNILRILLLSPENNHAQHWLLAKKTKLTPNQKRFIDLICQQHSQSLLNFLNNSPKNKDKSNNVEASPFYAGDTSQGKYRKQKSVILMIENYIRKSNKNNIFTDNPALEEEIIQYQNQLLSEIEAFKKKNQQQEQEQQTLKHFLKNITEEMSLRTAINMGLLDLFNPSTPTNNNLNTQMQRMLRNKLLSQKNLLDLILETLTQDYKQVIIVMNDCNALELLQEAMALFSAGNLPHNVDFESIPLLNNISFQGNGPGVVRTLRNLFDFLCQFHKYCGCQDKTKLKCEILESKKSVQYKIKLRDLTLSKVQISMLEKPQTLFDTVLFDYTPISIFHYFLYQNALKEGGVIQFTLSKKKDLICLLTLKHY